jgi:hypothetical protein
MMVSANKISNALLQWHTPLTWIRNSATFLYMSRPLGQSVLYDFQIHGPCDWQYCTLLGHRTPLDIQQLPDVLRSRLI